MAETSLVIPHWTGFYVIIGSSAGALIGTGTFIAVHRRQESKDQGES